MLICLGVTLRSLAELPRHFAETCSEQTVREEGNSKQGVFLNFEGDNTVVNFYQTSRSHIPRYITLLIPPSSRYYPFSYVLFNFGSNLIFCVNCGNPLDALIAVSTAAQKLVLDRSETVSGARQLERDGWQLNFGLMNAKILIRRRAESSECFSSCLRLPLTEPHVCKQSQSTTQHHNICGRYQH